MKTIIKRTFIQHLRIPSHDVQWYLKNWNDFPGLHREILAAACHYAAADQHDKHIAYMMSINTDLPPEPKMHPVTTVIVDPDTDLKFDVTVIKEVSQDAETYIETIIESKHPAYDTIKTKVAMLLMADTQEVPGLGHKFRDNVFVVVVDEDTYKAIRDVD